MLRHRADATSLAEPAVRALAASAPNSLLEASRTPYTVVPEALEGAGWIGSASEPTRRVWWSESAETSASFYQLGGITIFASMADDATMTRLAAALGEGWLEAEPSTSRDGRSAVFVWRHPDGGVLLPFDPSVAVENLLNESYAGGGRRSLGMAAYYRVRPLLPRRLQLALRRAYSRRQARRIFPRWPTEASLHELSDLVLEMTATATGRVVPTIDPWPDGFTWALVLTHDVETQVGYDNHHLLRNVEEETGYRSSWNFVPMRYAVSTDAITDLKRRGHEVGVHGLYHDGRDLASAAILAERLPAMRDYASRWDAVGFRSPATHRDWELMPLLGFDYDSSYPDTDPFEPQSGGCCSWLPFMNGPIVELPITLVQDHTLFEILRHTDGRLWVDKARELRARGGLALMITHPDYMLDEQSLEIYRGLLQEFRDDDQVWKALPCEVSRWWRMRADSRIVDDCGDWAIDGPGAGRGVIRLVSPSPADHPAVV